MSSSSSTDRSMAMVIAILMVIVGGHHHRPPRINSFILTIVPPRRLDWHATFVGAYAKTLEQAVGPADQQQVMAWTTWITCISLNATAIRRRPNADFDLKRTPIWTLFLLPSREQLAAAHFPPEVNNYGVTIKKSTSAPLMPGRSILAAWPPSMRKFPG